MDKWWWNVGLREGSSQDSKSSVRKVRPLHLRRMEAPRSREGLGLGEDRATGVWGVRTGRVAESLCKKQWDLLVPVSVLSLLLLSRRLGSTGSPNHPIFPGRPQAPICLLGPPLSWGEEQIVENYQTSESCLYHGRKRPKQTNAERTFRKHQDTGFVMDLESCLSRGDREASRGRISKKESETDKVLPTFFTKHIDVRLWIN